MDLDNIPDELSYLNPLKVHLVSLRIPFMKMVALPCGKQRAIHGAAVGVPRNPTRVCPSPKASISSTSGSSEVEEEVMLQGTLN